MWLLWTHLGREVQGNELFSELFLTCLDVTTVSLLCATHLFQELIGSDGGVIVTEVSHTGGHRFAGNVITSDISPCSSLSPSVPFLPLPPILIVSAIQLAIGGAMLSRLTFLEFSLLPQSAPSADPGMIQWDPLQTCLV